MTNVPTILVRVYFVVRNWTCQSYAYVERTERTFKLVFEGVVFALIYRLLARYTVGRKRIVLAAVTAHTVSWSLNGDVHVLRKSIGLEPDVSVPKKLSYLEAVCSRAAREPSIQAVGIVGSAARGEMTTTSDIDLRIVRQPGYSAAIGAPLFLLRERTRALFSGMPLDCYLYDSIDTFRKDGERPVIVNLDVPRKDITEQLYSVIERNR